VVEFRRALLRLAAAAIGATRRQATTLEGARRILVCANGGLGNAILLLPLLRALRAARPGATLDLMLSARPAAELATAGGWADRVFHVPERRWKDGLGSLRLFAGEIRRRRYDAVLRTFLTAPAMARASLAVYLSGARVRVAYGDAHANAFETHRLALDDTGPETHRHLALAAVLGISAPPAAEPLAAPPEGRRWAERFLGDRGWRPGEPLLGLHPGSDANFAAKRWPAGRFGEVANWAAASLGVRPVVIGGPDEGDDVDRVAAAAPSALVARGQSIVQTAGLIERCALFVSNDSGLMHLASALEVPTLAILGPTDPVKNRPLGARTRLLRLGLACSPCSKETARFLCGHHDCLETLEVGRVVAALGDLARSGGIFPIGALSRTAGVEGRP
jgi:heptosyltransferase-2